MKSFIDRFWRYFDTIIGQWIAVVGFLLTIFWGFWQLFSFLFFVVQHLRIEWVP